MGKAERESSKFIGNAVGAKTGDPGMDQITYSPEGPSQKNGFHSERDRKPLEALSQGSVMS